MSFASLSGEQDVTSRVKVAWATTETDSSTKTATCWPLVSGTHETSSDVLATLRFAAPMHDATTTGVPGVATGHELAT